MRWVALVMCFAVVACSGGETVGAPIEAEPYLSALLTPADTSNARVDSESPAAAALRACLDAEAESARSTALLIGDPFPYRIENSIDVFGSESAARKVIGRYDDSKRVANCIAEHMTPRIVQAVAGGDPSKVKIGTRLMTRHPSPNIGDRSMSMRVSIPIGAESWNAQSFTYVDVAAARKGPAVAVVVAVDALGVDRFTIDSYLRTVIGRMP